MRIRYIRNEKKEIRIRRKEESKKRAQRRLASERSCYRRTYLGSTSSFDDVNTSMECEGFALLATC